MMKKIRGVSDTYAGYFAGAKSNHNGSVSGDKRCEYYGLVAFSQDGSNRREI
jgi:hypothetical protein